MNPLDRRMLEYQLTRGPVSLQVVHPWRGCGYFTDADAVIRAFEMLERDTSISAIYTGLNPSTGPHGFRRHGATWPIEDSVASRSRILIDADPVRSAGLCATDTEMDAAVSVMAQTRDFLFSHGISRESSASALSGNGAHALLFVDWACNDRSDLAIKALLKGLSARFSTSTVTIDPTVCDRRRITKLYGCATRKQTADGRPCRRSGVLEMPELSSIEPVPLETVEDIVTELGALLPAKSAGATNPVTGSIGRKLKLLEQWASDGVFPAILFVKNPDSKGNVTVVLENCPRDESHIGTSAALLLFADGGWQPCCQHHGCKRLSRKEWWAEIQARVGHKLTFERELIRR